MFTFTADCLIGIPEIDEEHKKLFELIADTDRLLSTARESVSDAMLLLNELKHYAASHFAHEEAYMEQINDPELERQKKEHAAFTAKINSYSFTDVTEENARTILHELLEYLAKWLICHILGSDILIGQIKSSPKTKTGTSAIPVFDDSFKTGIVLIDEEHKTLFDIIGKIYTTLEAQLLHDKYDAIMDIIGELKEYTRVHFSDEEEYMRSIGYEGLANQQLLHQSFIDTLNEVDLNEVDDNQQAYLYECLDFLKNWLVNHILKVDKQIPVK